MDDDYERFALNLKESLERKLAQSPCAWAFKEFKLKQLGEIMDVAIVFGTNDDQHLTITIIKTQFEVRQLMTESDLDKGGRLYHKIYYEWNANTIVEFMKALPTLKFDKSRSKFTTKERNLTSSFNQIVSSLPNIQLYEADHTDCSVCREPTNLKTQCGHTLCLICWDKIHHHAIKSGAKNWHKKIKCPCCRKMTC